MKNLRFAIVAGRYNAPYADRLVDAARRGLGGHACDIVRVPGAFEIPLQAQRLARTRKYAAILALGIVWQGRTQHATEILRAATDGLMRISLECNVPVIHAVLSVKNEAEARARTSGRLNRGAEAARTALALCDVRPNKSA